MPVEKIIWELRNCEIDYMRYSFRRSERKEKLLANIRCLLSTEHMLHFLILICCATLSYSSNKSSSLRGSGVLNDNIPRSEFHGRSAEEIDEYDQNLVILMEISTRQQKDFIIETWVLPEVLFNPGLAPWVFDADFNESSEFPNFLLTWNSKIEPWSVSYIVISSGKTRDDWKPVKRPDSIEIFDSHDVAHRRPLPHAADMRIFRVGNATNLRATYWRASSKTKCHDLYLADLYYNKALDALYLLGPEIRISTTTEFQKIQSEKNWSPFTYYFHESSKAPVNLFVQWIHPHRIMTIPSDDLSPIENDIRTVQARFISQSNIMSSDVSEHQINNPVWKHGHLHGGTPSVLVDTPYGKKYLTFFHSQGQYMASWCTTYFMGAYLFEPFPPFEITHLSPEPIFPNDFYNASVAGGWAFKGIDFIIFPSGIHVADGIIFVATGRNDRSGWMLTLNQTKFLLNLKAFSTEKDSIHSKFASNFE